MQNQGVKSKSIRRTVARLAQYRPFGDGQPQVDFARRALVVAAARESEGGFDSLVDCQEACITLWGLRLDLDEVRVAVDALVEDGVFVRDGGAVLLSDAESESLDNRIDADAARNRQAIHEWEIRLNALFPELTPVEIDDLKEDLETWVQQMIVGHGVEAALVVYPEHDRSSDFVDALAGFGFDNLPKRDPRLDAIRRQAIHLFVKEPTASQRDYLLNLLNTAYMLAVYTIDPAANELVKGITRGQRVYLDTNVVYSILNLAGPREYMTARRIIDLTRDLGYEIAVTPWTVNEMKTSVKNAREKLRRTTLPPKALADIAADACSDESFVTAYWRKFKETGVTADDFLDFHEQIESKLSEIGISVVENGCVAVDKDEDGLAEQLGLLSTIPGGASKSLRIQEHDVKHRLLVERLRGVAVRRFSNAGYWFLTRDSVLIPYASERKESKESLPFAMSLQAWANVVRSLSPKTDDFEQTLVDLMDSDAARANVSVSLSTISKVLGRVHFLVQDSSEEVATRMLLDAAALTKIEETPADSQEGAIDLLVTEKSDELARQLAELQQSVARERANREEAEASRKRTEQQLQSTKLKLFKARDRVIEAENSGEQTASAAAAQIQSLEDDLKRVEAERVAFESRNEEKINKLKDVIDSEHTARLNERERFRRRSKRAMLIALALFSVASFLLPLLWSTFSTGLPLAIAITVGVLLALGVFGAEVGWKKASFVVTAIGVALALLTGVLAVTDSLDDSSDVPASQTNPGKVD